MSPVVDQTLALFILRAALGKPSRPSNLVLEGIFTIASLQLYGHARSLCHRSKLLSMLQDNLALTDRESVLQNLIGTMLLYQFEVIQARNPLNLTARPEKMLIPT